MIILLGFSLNSCYYDSDADFENYNNNGGNNGGETPTDLTFKNDIAPLFERCLGCHSGTQSPDLREEFAYDALVPDYVTPNNAEGSELYIKLSDNHGGIGGDDLELIKAWINQGAIE